MEQKLGGTETFRPGGQYTKDARREARRRQLRLAGYVGLILLAAATISVVVFALRR